MKTYWFTRPGYLSTEAARITLALIYLYCNWRYDPVSAESLYSGSLNVSAYYPKSIVAIFFPSTPPSAETLNTIILIARLSPLFLLAGFFSKSSSVICLFSNLFLRALIESFGPVWSHGFNVIFLCHLAFIFAPVGQFLSVDAFISKKRKKNLQKSCRNGFWCIVLAQWAAALMFFGAFYHKVITKAHALSLPWAFTDNLRNQTLYRYESLGEDVPGYLEPIINNAFYFKTFAFANLVLQAMVIVSLFLIHKPRLRLIFGMCFILEEIGLSFFFQLHDWQWFPLIVFFVDWDYFFPRIIKKTDPRPEFRNRKIIRIFIYSFITFYVLCTTRYITIFTGHSVFDLRAYPFSEFSMYSVVLDNRPENPSVIFESMYEVNRFDRNAAICRNIKRNYYGTYNTKGYEDLKNTCSDLMKKLERGTFGPFNETIGKFAILNSVTTFTRSPQKAGLIRKFTGFSLLFYNGKYLYAGVKNHKKHNRLVFSGFSPFSIKMSYINRKLETIPLIVGPNGHFKKPAEYHYAYNINVLDSSWRQPVTFLVFAE